MFSDVEKDKLVLLQQVRMGKHDISKETFNSRANTH